MKTESDNWSRMAWVRPIWDWLCCRPLLFLTTALLIAVVWGWVGVDYGVPNLFWNKNHLTQFFAGVGAAWLLGQVSFVGYLLARDASWMKNRSLRWYLCLTWVPALLLVLLRVLIRVSGNDLFATTYNDVSHKPFVGGLALGALAALGLLCALIYFPRLRKYLAWPSTKALSVMTGLRNLFLTPLAQSCSGTPAPEAAAENLPARTDWAGMEGCSIPAEGTTPTESCRREMQDAFFCLLLVIYVSLAFSPLQVVVFPALAVCLMFGLLVAVYGFVVLHFPRMVYPVCFFLILLVILLNQAPDKHRFEDLKRYYDDRQPLDLAHYQKQLDREDHCGLLDTQEALENWLEYYRAHHARDQAQSPKVLLVTASGGGIRSALWTVVVLSKLEQEIPGFFYHVRLISGASGGMLGAAYFSVKLDRLRDWDEQRRFHADWPPNESSQVLLAKRAQEVTRVLNPECMKLGGLREVAQHWALRDMPGLYWPLPYYHDRGWALEKAWQTNLDSSLGHPLRSLQDGERLGWRPSMVFSPMLVEDGRRLLISNLDLQALGESNGSLFVADEQRLYAHAAYSSSAVEFFRLFREATDFKINTAVRMSASFPFVSPVAALPTEPPRRVVDAGYYDNYGVNIAALWIYENLDWLRKHTSGVVLVQIRDQVSQSTRQDLGMEDTLYPRSFWERGLGELLTPVEGVLRAHQAGTLFRSDEQLQVLNDQFNTEKDGFFTTFVFQCPIKAALSWYLTDFEYNTILASAGGEISPDLNLDNATRQGIDKNERRVAGLKKLLATP
jgi:hypothetical protein